MKNASSLRRRFQFLLWLCLMAWLFQAQAQLPGRSELDTLVWADIGTSLGLAPGTYAKPGSPSETIVSNFPLGGPPEVFCNPSYGSGLYRNGQTLVGYHADDKGYFETLNDYGGSYTLTRTYKVTPGKATYMRVRMASIWQTWLRPSSISASIDGRSLGSADRYNSSYWDQRFLESSQFWTPTSDLVRLVITTTMPGGCHADELILYVDQFYQAPGTILAVDDTGATVDSNGGQSLANVLANDYLNNATPTLATVNLSQLASSQSTISLNPATGAVTVAPGTPAGRHQLSYQMCEKANPTNCSQATVTVNVTLAPGTITVVKALAGGGRINPADQFTVNLLHNHDRSVAASGTTRGSGSTVAAGSGSTGPVAVDSPDDGAYYLLNETMAPGSVSALAAYSTTLACQNHGVAVTNVDYVHAFTDVLSAYPGDTIVCTIRNASPAAGPTLTVRQIVLKPFPDSLRPPFTFSITGDNGWSAPALTVTAINQYASTAAVPLAAANTATRLSVTLPDTHWFVGNIRCEDLNAPGSGNPSGTLLNEKAGSITIPANLVLPGSRLLCSVQTGHTTP